MMHLLNGVYSILPAATSGPVVSSDTHYGVMGEANAALICRAVNAYEGLVNAVTKHYEIEVEQLDEKGYNTPKWYCAFCKCESYTKDEKGAINHWLDCIVLSCRQALAQAGEGEIK